MQARRHGNRHRQNTALSLGFVCRARALLPQFGGPMASSTPAGTPPNPPSSSSLRSQE